MLAAMLKRLPDGTWSLEDAPLRPGDRVEVYQLDEGWREVALLATDLAPTGSLVAGVPGSAIRRVLPRRPAAARSRSPRSRKRW